MKKLFVFFAVFSFLFSEAQNENANWCFPYRARINFNSGPPVLPTTCENTNNAWIDGYGITCASVSNSNGDLLFYTDGVRVWDNTDNLMPNGNNIGGGTSTGWAEQAVAIVPKPGSTKLYYVFTVCKVIPPNSSPFSSHTGFHYAMIDMTLNGGLGDVVQLPNSSYFVPLNDENSVPIDYDPGTSTGQEIYEGSMTTALYDEPGGIWLTIFARFHNGSVIKRIAYSYLITSSGINQAADGTSPDPTSSSPSLPVYCPYSDSRCYDESGSSIKIAHNGEWLCNEIADYVDMYQYDNHTGAVTYNNRVFTGAPAVAIPGYGIEFSLPDVNNHMFIYFATYDCGLCQARPAGSNPSGIGIGPSLGNYIRIRQAELQPERENDNVVVGEFEVPSLDGKDAVLPVGGRTYGDLQLGPDGRIYCCANSIYTVPTNANLAVIYYPDLQGTACTYLNDYFTLYPGSEQYGSLPPWVYVAQEPWPKTYSYATVASQLLKDQNHNVVAQFSSSTISQTINHFGPFPSTPSNPEALSVQYSNLGITTWYVEHPNSPTSASIDKPVFVTDGGDVQWTNSGPFGIVNYLYTNCQTGSSSSGPSSWPSPASERLAAQVSSTEVMTVSGQTVKVYSSGTVTDTKSFSNPIVTKFNRTTNKLYVIESSGTHNYSYCYSLSGGTLSLLTTFDWSGDATSFVQVDNNNNLYFIDNSVLKKYSHNVYTSAPSAVSMTGYDNSYMIGMLSSNPYTEDQLIVICETKDRLYSLDLAGSICKYIQTTNLPFTGVSGDDHLSYPYYYAYDGSDIYISGATKDADLYLNGQYIPALGLSQHSVFITKINLGEFNRETGGFGGAKGIQSITSVPLAPKNKVEKNTVAANSSSQSKITLSPNPVRDVLTVALTDDITRIDVVDSYGNNLMSFSNHQKTVMIPVGKLSSGYYYLLLTDSNGKKSFKAFSKL